MAARFGRLAASDRPRPSVFDTVSVYLEATCERLVRYWRADCGRRGACGK